MTIFDGKHREEPSWEAMARSIHEWEDVQRQRVPYGAALRMLGAYLDEQAACFMHAMEVVDGFLLRYQSTPGDLSPVVREVTYADILSLTRELEQKRKRRPFSFGNKRQAEGPSRYENTLRALGDELDEAQAYSLLVDEVDDGFLVTYQYLNPSQGSMVRKRMVFLDLDSIARALTGAQARRKEGQKGLLTLQTG